MGMEGRRYGTFSVEYLRLLLADFRRSELISFALFTRGVDCPPAAWAADPLEISGVIYA